MDVGSVRVGVALSDPDGLLATPLVTVPRDGRSAAAVAALADEHDVVGVVVGLSRTLAGREGAAAEAARAFVAELEPVLAVPVELSDERLTTVVATRQLRESGRKGRRRREVVDQVAAVGILQGWLDTHR
ncbi:MAG: Holliday junction resolvase RuvX [Pseudonocardiales bacterium]|nr:Holliday junction resolvase RuvX [Pseudonocardiales bacterium]